MRALTYIHNHAWCITEDALRTMIEITSLDREERQALATQYDTPLERTAGVTTRNGVAVVSVIGPIMRYANIFTYMSGATSTEVLAKDFTTALNDPAISTIVLNIDSPGGQAAGMHELTEMIYAARGRKRMVAYVGDMAASGGYWIASAADEIVIDRTATLGSLGVIATASVARRPDQITFTSSQSPNKSPDLTQTDGRSQIQEMIDVTAQVFIESVERNRTMAAGSLMQRTNGGGLFVGQAAIDTGLADRFGSLEQLLTEYSTNTQPSTRRPRMAQAGGEPPRLQGVSSMSITHDPVAESQDEINATAPPVEAQASAPAPAPVQMSAPDLSAMVEQIAKASTNQDTVAQMANMLQEQMQAQFTEMQARANTEVQRRFAEMQAQQEIERFAYHVTNGTLDRPHALPLEANRIQSFMGGLNTEQRKEYRAQLEHILSAGMVEFDEIGSEGDGMDSKTLAIEQFEAKVEAQIDSGKTRYQAIRAAGKAYPDLYRAYQDAGGS